MGNPSAAKLRSFGMVPSLDGLRGIAVLLVMFLHFDWLAMGWVGVQLFYVLSGFLISTNLMLARDVSSAGETLRSFYLKRFLRIFPLYYLSLAFTYLLEKSPLFERIYTHPASFSDWAYICHALFIQNFSPYIWGEAGAVRVLAHFWSLAVEEQFYIVFPFLFLLTTRKQLVAICAATLVLCPAYRAWVADISVYKDTLSQADAFGFGVVMAALWQRFDFRDWATSNSRQITLTILGSMALLLLFGLIVLRGYRATGYPVSTSSFGFEVSTYALSYIWVFTAFNAVGAALILYCLLRPGQWLLAHPVLRYLGKISFGLYVYHYPIALAFEQNFQFKFKSAKGVALFVVYFGLTVAISTVSFYLWEKKFLRLKDLYSSFTHRSRASSI